MKIKQLHIRNIASIVQADIDFEHDLNDRTTGAPSVLFLICGDTGAGKSAILDAISMALYRDTPRLDGVANKKRNSFNNGLNDDVNIDSIQQYTRLGISSKDDCFSEVVFEAVDGGVYTARLSLGFVRGEKNYRSVQWMYRKEGEDWQQVDARTGHPLDLLAGLSFEQFGRMAMLAQGQFASFLTGDKKERESILEQLTNTESFTRYGQAIRELAKAKKGDYESSKKVFDAEARHLLSEEQVEELTRRRTSLEAEADEAKTLIGGREERIQRVTLILKEEARREEAVRQKAALEDVRNGRAHRAKEQLVADWNRTETVRGRLDQLRTARGCLQEALLDEEQQMTLFRRLLADLEARRAGVAAMEERAGREASWLDARDDRRALREAQSGLCISMNRYKQDAAKLAQGRLSLAGETDRTVALEAQADAAAKVCLEAKRIRDAKQAEVDAQRRRVDAMNPAEIGRQVAAWNGRVTALARMQVGVDNLKKEAEQLEAARKEWRTATARLAVLKGDVDAKCRACEAARSEKEKADKRLTTMGASLETQLSEIRSRLVDGHEDFCPLCGQRLQQELLDTAHFERLLSPIRQEQEEADRLWKEADRAYNAVRTDFNRLDGSLKPLQAAGEKLKETMRQRQLSLLAEWERLNEACPEGDSPEAWAEAVGAALDVSHRRLEELRKTQEKAAELQAALNGLNEAMNAAVSDYSRTEKAWTDAKNLLVRNQENILRLKAENGRMEQELNALRESLEAALAPFYPRWMEDMDATAQRLKAEAEEYRLKQEAYLGLKAELDRERIVVDGLRGQAETLSRDYPDAAAEGVARLYPCRDIRSEWSALIASLNRIRSGVEGCRKTMAECASVVDDFCRQSGMDEPMLAALMLRSGEIERARQDIAKLEQDWKSWSDVVRSADGCVAKEMEALGVGAREEVPALPALLEEKEALTARLGAVNQQLGSVTASLTDNLRNRERAQRAERDCTEKEAVYRKWAVMDKYFGDTKLRTLVQSYVLRPLLNNANIYLERITDRYKLTCSKDNEQLSILVHDLYNKGQLRSATILSGGERFMISLALSLALSSLNRQDMNVNILFIDEGFGTLDEKSLNSVMATLEKLQEIAGQSNRRVGIISHREELAERIPVQIQVRKRGEGRSFIEIRR